MRPSVTSLAAVVLFLLVPGGFANEFYGGQSSKKHKDQLRIAIMRTVIVRVPQRTALASGSWARGIRWLDGTPLQNQVHCCVLPLKSDI